MEIYILYLAIDALGIVTIYLYFCRDERKGLEEIDEIFADLIQSEGLCRSGKWCWVGKEEIK